MFIMTAIKFDKGVYVMFSNAIFALWGLCGYLIGSIPFGLLLCLIFGYGDIRKSGSGNIGATNVLRVSKSKMLALLTIIFDASKAGIIAYIAMKIVSPKPAVFCGIVTQLNILVALISGTMAILGHNFPIWLKFKGGKGVASSFGLILAVAPLTALSALAIWIVAAVIFRYSSLAAIIAALSAPLISFFANDLIYTVFIAFLALLLLIRHRANFTRLLKGEESKISFSKDKTKKNNKSKK